MEMQKEKLLAVVVPVYNEASSLLNNLPQVVSHCTNRSWYLILVNDGSDDDSRRILSEYGQLSNVTVLHHKLNRGYGGALKTGIINSNALYTVTIDGDGQHNIEDIDGLLKYAIESDSDLVVGCRRSSTGKNWYRAVGKSLIRMFTKILMPLPISDLNSGFKLYKTDIAKLYLPLCPDSMAFSDVITLAFISQRRLVLEYPISINARYSGKSTINTYTALDTLMEIVNLIMLFNPLRIFLPISVICICFGLAWGAHFVWMGNGVSTGSLLAIVSGLLFFFLGLVASQLSAIRIKSLD